MRSLPTVRPMLGVFVIFLVLAGIAISPAPALAAPNVTGQWSTLPYLVPVNPIHVALLPNGKVLIVAGSESNPPEAGGPYKYAVWDPAAGTFNEYTTPWDLFCNGMSYLPDGRLILTGGTLSYEDTTTSPQTPFHGLNVTTVFDPATEQFIQLENMAHGRWYPTNTFLGDGTMTFSGLDENGVMNQTAEIYDVGAGWSGPYMAPFVPKWYPRMHLLGDGKVINTAPDPPTYTFDPTTGTWSGVNAFTNYQNSRVYGASVLLPLRPEDGYAHRIVIIGGDTAGATNTVEEIDTSVSPESWTSLPSMVYPRTTLNAVLLPSGKIVAVGGSKIYNDAATAALNAEMFDPVSKTWALAGTQSYARLYHSSALLMPDGTVWSAGSNPADGVWELHMEIYKPPYLFTSTGALAPRPTISALPTVVGYGDTFTITTPDAANIKDVVLMRPGSATHAFDMEQRMLHTTFTTGNGTLSVTAPNNPFAAPAGYYMVFLLNTSGVPSVAKFMRLAKNPNNQPPTATITNPSTSSVTIQAGQSVTFAGSASDPDGSVAVYQWIFPGGSPAKSNVPTPGAVTFANPGTYIVSLTVLDDLGDNNVSPPSVTVNVTAATSLTAAITSPASGATVGGTVAVNMAASNASGSPTQFVLKLDNATTLSTQSVSGSTATYAWDTSGVTAGAHTLNLTVTDSTGQTASTSVSVTVSSGGGTGPSVSITSPFNGDWIGNSVEIKSTASSSVGLTSLKVWGNGGVVATVPCSGTTCSGDIWWITGSLPAAAYQIQVVALDTAGKSVVSAPVTVNKDATSPVKPSGAGGATPPALTASITSPASGATVSGTVTVNMAAGNASGSPTKFVLKLDNATTLSTQSVTSGSTATYAWNTSGVAAGAHTLNLTVTDGAGRTASASVSVTVSGTPPPALTASITSPASGATVSGTVTVNMAAGNASGSPTQFLLKLDNATTLSTQSVSGSTATYAWNTSGVATGAHTLNLTVTDGAGRTATASVSVTVSSGGGTGPTVSITSPFNGDWIGNSVEVKSTASSSVGLATLKVWGNGGVVATVICSGTSCTGDTWWITGSLPPAAYQIQVVATDTAGKSTVSAPVTVNKDATSPVVPSGAGGGTPPPPPALTASITSPANGATVSGTVTVNMAAGNAQGSPTQFALMLDGATTLSSQSVSGSTATYAWNTSGVAAGSHTLNLTVTDSTGRTATASVSVTVSSSTGGDTTPPTVAITSPPNGAWTGNSIDVHVSGTDNVAVATIKIYGDGKFVDQVTCGSASCSGVVWWLTGSLASGTHTITAVAADTSGNQTTTPPVTINK